MIVSSWKNQTNEKNILFWKLCWLLSSEVIWSTSDLRFVQVISVEKRKPRGTFLSLGLRPWLQKPFPKFPFFLPWLRKPFTCCPFLTLITWEKSNYTWNSFPESSQNNHSNKILLLIFSVYIWWFLFSLAFRRKNKIFCRKDLSMLPTLLNLTAYTTQKKLFA